MSIVVEICEYTRTLNYEAYVHVWPLGGQKCNRARTRRKIEDPAVRWCRLDRRNGGGRRAKSVEVPMKHFGKLEIWNLFLAKGNMYIITIIYIYMYTCIFTHYPATKTVCRVLYGHDILAYTSCVRWSMLNWGCNRHKADGTGYGSIDTQGSERKGIRPKIFWQVEWGQWW